MIKKKMIKVYRSTDVFFVFLFCLRERKQITTVNNCDCADASYLHISHFIFINNIFRNNSIVLLYEIHCGVYIEEQEIYERVDKLRCGPQNPHVHPPHWCRHRPRVLLKPGCFHILNTLTAK